jgi:hypothetical protein
MEIKSIFYLGSNLGKWLGLVDRVNNSLYLGTF